MISKFYLSVAFCKVENIEIAQDTEKMIIIIEEQWSILHILLSL